MPNGTLTEYLAENPNADRTRLVNRFYSVVTPSLIEVFTKLLDVAEGPTFLHENCTTHGDLKGVGIFFLATFNRADGRSSQTFLLTAANMLD